MRKFVVVVALGLACGKGEPGEEGGSSTGMTSAPTASEATTTGNETMIPTTGEPGPTTTGPEATTGEATTGEATTGGEPGVLTWVLAIDELLLGDSDPDGTPNADDGWRQYGRDVDGLVSTAAATDLCKPANNGAPANVYPDGDDGIDNAFGKSVLGIFFGLDPAYSETANASIDEGRWTLLFAPADPEQVIAPSFPAWLLTGDVLGAPAKFDGSDLWPIDPRSLVDAGDPGSARCQFSATSLVGDELVAGPDCELMVRLPMVGDVVLDVPVRAARLRFTLAADQASASGGQLSGVIPTEALVEAVTEAAGGFDPSLCEGATIESIQAQIRQASDILSDGTQDPGKTCDGISIGLGFTMRAVQLGPVAAVQPEPPKACP